MKYSEIIKVLDDNISYLKTHNKNLTKKQDYAVEDIQEAIHELKVLIYKSGCKL